MFGEQSSIVVCFLKGTGDGGRGGVFVFMRSALKSPSEPSQEQPRRGAGV